MPVVHCERCFFLSEKKSIIPVVAAAAGVAGNSHIQDNPHKQTYLHFVGLEVHIHSFHIPVHNCNIQQHSIGWDLVVAAKHKQKQQIEQT